MLVKRQMTALQQARKLRAGRGGSWRNGILLPHRVQVQLQILVPVVQVLQKILDEVHPYDPRRCNFTLHVANLAREQFIRTWAIYSLTHLKTLLFHTCLGPVLVRTKIC